MFMLSCRCKNERVRCGILNVGMFVKASIRLRNATSRFVSSKSFFVCVMVLFVVQSGWIALSTGYPLAYDETYHVEAISAFEDRAVPFVAKQDPSENSLGDITRYGSYLYHFVMSFPARVVDFFQGSQYLKVELLRWINIGIFVIGLVYLRKLLLKARFSNGIVNVALLATVLVPLTSYLAATVNYDSLFFLFTVLHLFILIRVYETRCRDFGVLSFYLATGVAGSLTKYPFLPIFVASFIVVLYLIFRKFNARQVFEKLKKSAMGYGRWKLVLLGAMLVLSIGLFSERYLYNVAAYKSPNPDCSRIHSIKDCEQWGPWRRNYELSQKHAPDSPGVVGFTSFVTTYWYDGIVASSSLIGNASNQSVASKLSLKWLYAIAGWCIVIGLIVLFSLRRNVNLMLIMLSVAAYMLSLLLLNYQDFRTLGVAVGAQARYLLWIIPIVFALSIYGVDKLVNTLYGKSKTVKLTLLLVMLLASLQFGGLMTYWFRYQPSWSWNGQPTVVKINTTMSKVAKKIVLVAK
jgi:hypothetical protein